MKELASAERVSLSQQIADLETAPRKQLAQQWVKLYDRAPPPNTSRALLTLGVGYKIQEKALGGLKPSVLRRLFTLAKGNEQPDKTSAPTRGTVFVRVWQGVTHTVTVLDDGVLYQSNVYRSLTHVARHITGAHQSGYIFFGLTKRKAA